MLSAVLVVGLELDRDDERLRVGPLRPARQFRERRPAADDGEDLCVHRLVEDDADLGQGRVDVGVAVVGRGLHDLRRLGMHLAKRGAGLTGRATGGR